MFWVKSTFVMTGIKAMWNIFISDKQKNIYAALTLWNLINPGLYSM